MSNCHSVASIIFGDSESDYNGGLAGANYETIIDCSFVGTVSGGSQDCGDIGGLVGQNVGNIYSSYSSGTVFGSTDVGGLCGFAGDYSAISNCWSLCKISGKSSVGGLIGFLNQNSILSDCFASGDVTMIDGSWNFGGLVGACQYATVERCYSTGDLSSTATGVIYQVGGFVGSAYNSQIMTCYTSGDVASSNAMDSIGGFCGQANGQQYNMTISNCYSTGSILCMAGPSEALGGFVGWIDGVAVNCYSIGSLDLTGSLANVGDFCGYDNRINNSGRSWTTSGCYWNSDLSSRGDTSGATGKTTAEMQAESTFTAAGWDFTNTWIMHGYPELQAFDTVEKIDYLTWAANEGIPLPQRGPEDTPADDGIPNILKYVTGLPAMTPATPGDVMSIAAVGEDGMFSITYTKSKTAEGAELFPVWADGLGSEWIPEGITHELIETDGDVETWKVSIPLQTKGFMRLNVLLPEE